MNTVPSGVGRALASAKVRLCLALPFKTSSYEYRTPSMMSAFPLSLQSRPLVGTRIKKKLKLTQLSLLYCIL